MAETAIGQALPRMRGHPVLGNIPDLRSDIMGTLMSAWREHGDIVGLRAHVPICLVTHPDYVRHVLLDNHRNYPKTPFVDDAWRQAVGEGLICSKGEFWLRQRRIVAPIFHKQRLAGFGKLITDTTTETLDRWQERTAGGEPLDMRTEMIRLTLSILARALFSTDWTQESALMGPAVAVLRERMYQRLEKPFDIPEWVPIRANHRLKKARGLLDDIVYGLIAERRREESEGEDLLTMLIQARDDETGETMSDRQVHDEVMTMIFGGHETVATGLMWLWRALSEHPEIGRRLREELAGALGGRVPTVDDVDRLPYTARVIDESMRLYPPVWLISRTPLEDDEIGGYHVPAGTMVFISPYVTHRRPDFWENPEGFDPERFLPERSEGRHRYAYFPFSGGPRKCVGPNFALLEMILIVATIAQRFHLDLVPGRPVVFEPGIVLQARRGVWVRARPAA